jgi:DNA-binding transcriptional ArsR family regulator
MTRIQIACAAALFLLSVPVAVSAAEVHNEQNHDVDAVHMETSLYAALLGSGVQMDGMESRDAFQVDAAYMASMIPADSQLAAILQFLLAMQPEPTTSSTELPVDADAETQSLVQQGVVAQGETHATPEEVSTVAQVSAGSHSQEAGASARPADQIPEPVEQAAQAVAPGAADVQSETAAQEPLADEPAMEPPAAALTASDESVVLDALPLPVAIAATAAILTTSAGAALVVVPGWRTALLRILRRFGWLVLFSRIAQEDVLNHERRSELLEYVRNNPGERVEVARRSLGFSNGSMHYHLRVLQDRQLVKILKEGSLARLYPRGPKITPAPYVPQQRKKFVEVLSAEPGKTQRELAATLGLSERMVSYHVRALAQQGLVEVRAEGARKRLFPAQSMAPVAVLAPAA